MDDSAALHTLGFCHFLHKIFRIGYAGGCRIGNPVSSNDIEQILSEMSLLALCNFTNGSSGCPRTVGGGAGSLDACIHIGFIIIAQINDIVISFAGTGNSLKTNIHRTAVTGNTKHRYVFQSQRFNACRHTANRSGKARESRNRLVEIQCVLREIGCRCSKAACGNCKEGSRP
ncbi:hypothetical protein SDC9_142693 [bioreactor metagenome]|uniref:Uncharacterized protein n=1 Tax=bioreactor metagenome TaxID=1076179 RepID=A0A645E2C1_9ZZZZ